MIQKMKRWEPLELSLVFTVTQKSFMGQLRITINCVPVTADIDSARLCIKILPAPAKGKLLCNNHAQKVLHDPYVLFFLFYSFSSI